MSGVGVLGFELFRTFCMLTFYKEVIQAQVSLVLGIDGIEFADRVVFLFIAPVIVRQILVALKCMNM